MIILARNEWEYSDKNLNQIFGETNAKRYSCVEISLNVVLFHIDYRQKPDENGLIFCDRFIMASISDVLSVIKQKRCDEELLISLQKRRVDNKNNEYSISTIDEIRLNTDASGNSYYKYVCNDCSEYVDTDIVIDELHAIESTVVYKRVIDTDIV